MYYRVRLDTPFLLAGLGMSSDSLENSIGEQRDGSGINDSKLFYPLFRAVASAVRGKNVFIGGIQIAIDLFKELLTLCNSGYGCI